MNTLQQVHLGNGLQAKNLQRIDEQPGLDTIASEKGELLQSAAPPRILTGERLDQARQFWKEEVDERPRSQLRHPPTTTGDELIALLERAPVETFDIPDTPVAQQWPQDAIHKSGVDVFDVGVYPGYDISLEDIEALPEGFSFATVGTVLRQNVLVDIDWDTQVSGNLTGVVYGTGVNQDDFIQQRYLFHQGGLDCLDDGAYCFLFIEGRQTQANSQSTLFLESDQTLQVGKFATMKCVFGKPFVHDDGDGAVKLGRHHWRGSDRSQGDW